MKRTIRLFLLSTLSFGLLLVVSGAQPSRSTPPAGKVNIPCPANIKKKHIDKCPETGCGLLDPNLNRRHCRNSRLQVSADESEIA